MGMKRSNFDGRVLIGVMAIDDELRSFSSGALILRKRVLLEPG